ncbi:hypothetical protein F5B20DRAFT_8443 [Whalleya microplaca]|nr:hypothetical protein F5B20DRAFT_8443 [Whalleya microplaca]
MRLYVRYSAGSNKTGVDIVGVSTLLLYLTYIILGMFVRITAIGYDIWQLDEATITDALKVLFVSELFYIAVLTLCRVGILLFLKPVFAGPGFRIMCWVIITWVVLTTTVVMFLKLFQCLPLAYNWEGWKGTIDNPRCLDVNALNFATAGLGITQDIIILLLPLLMVAQLNMMSMNQKLLALFMCSFGVFVTVLSTLRLRYLVGFANSSNPTWDGTDAVAWTSAEASLSVVVLCLPAVGTLLARRFPQVFWSDDDDSDSRPARSHRRDDSYADISSKDSSELESGSPGCGSRDVSMELLGPVHIKSKGIDKQWIQVEETHASQQGVHLVPDDLDPDLGPEVICAAEPARSVTKERRFWRRW